MLNEHIKAEKTLKYVSKALLLIVDNDGEDVTCYRAAVLDDLIIKLIKARSLMSIADTL